MTSPASSPAIHQMVAFLKRALRRPLLTISLSAALAGSLVGLMVLKEQRFAPRSCLRAVEMDRDPAQAPQPKRHLREYVLGAVFTQRSALRS
jgi:hypothetical protein